MVGSLLTQRLTHFNVGTKMALTTKFFNTTAIVTSSVSGASTLYNASSALLYTVPASRTAKVIIAALSWFGGYLPYSGTANGNLSLRIGSYTFSGQSMYYAPNGFISGAYNRIALPTNSPGLFQGNDNNGIAYNSIFESSNNLATPSYVSIRSGFYAPREYYLGAGQTVTYSMDYSRSAYNPWAGSLLQFEFSFIVIEESAS